MQLALEQMVAVLEPGGLFILWSPLNFQTTSNWKFGKPERLIQLLQELGIEQIISEDNIQHIEVLDARWNSKMWNALVIWGRKEDILKVQY